MKKEQNGTVHITARRERRVEWKFNHFAVFLYLLPFALLSCCFDVSRDKQLLHNKLCYTNNESQVGTDSLTRCTRLLYTEKLVYRNAAIHRHFTPHTLRLRLRQRQRLRALSSNFVTATATQRTHSQLVVVVAAVVVDLA